MPTIRSRERREHRIFQRLMEMVPGLEDRLVEGSDEGVVHIAELVSGYIILRASMGLTYSRSRKVLPAQDPMTRRA